MNFGFNRNVGAAGVRGDGDDDDDDNNNNNNNNTYLLTYLLNYSMEQGPS